MPESKYNTYSYFTAVYNWLYPTPAPPPPTLMERAEEHFNHCLGVAKHQVSVYSSMAVPFVATILLLLLPLCIFLWSSGPPAPMAEAEGGGAGAEGRRGGMAMVAGGDKGEEEEKEEGAVAQPMDAKTATTSDQRGEGREEGGKGGKDVDMSNPPSTSAGQKREKPRGSPVHVGPGGVSSLASSPASITSSSSSSSSPSSSSSSPLFGSSGLAGAAAAMVVGFPMPEGGEEGKEGAKEVQEEEEAAVGCCGGDGGRGVKGGKQSASRGGGGGGGGCACMEGEAADIATRMEVGGNGGGGGCCKGGKEEVNDVALREVGGIKQVPLKVLVGSGTGTGKKLAEMLQHERLLVLICSTWTDGVPPPAAKPFFDYLEDASKDFRYGGSALKKIRFGVFGLGSCMYEEESFCKPAIEMETFLCDLGAKNIVELGTGDDTVDLSPQFTSWTESLWPALCEEYAKITGVTPLSSSSSGCGSCGSTTATGGKSACSSSNSNNSSNKNSSSNVYKAQGSWEEMEKKQALKAARKGGKKGGRNGKVHRYGGSSGSQEGGGEGQEEGAGRGPRQQQQRRRGMQSRAVIKEGKEGEDEEEEDADLTQTPEDEVNLRLVEEERRGGGRRGGGGAGEVAEVSAPREMVTPLQRKKLTKEGYKLIGSHSAVKLCRWTKHQLRGRGGCYKHTFYGITSYQCMEMTPALACANRCVFCWRHGTNPVGREWRWAVDDPAMIVKESIEKHQDMINIFKGVPGVKPERWQEAFTVAHCALSLVGEPIMYPHINELVSELHRRNISSFLVTNAQFPEKIAALSPVTQLYVSIDAATKETLKAIDRPLFRDYWERFLSSLQQLRLKGQRTVYRLTLVKAWNMNEVDSYAELIGMGEPDLIEIKGVTFCGKSALSTLRMEENVPWHHEVRAFAQAISDRTSGTYEFMAEHAHSCCTLLARKDKFYRDGKWFTWIDYAKFQELIEKFEKDGTEFDSADYCAETPSWALKGSPEEGFDPIDTRYRKVRGGGLEEIPYRPTDSGCG
ncbi:trna wybutosine-synthesizing protein 1 homolog [Nannochloropsis oceanica]